MIHISILSERLKSRIHQSACVFRGYFSLGIITLLTLTGLLSVSSGASAQSTVVKISQVYSGGGGSTGSYLRDYVELYNTSCTSVNIGGWSIAYGSSTGNYGSIASNIFTFPAGTTIGPKKYLLIECGASGTAGTVLPVTADFATATTGFSMSGTAGKVGLFNTTISNVACSLVVATTLVDNLSWGSANCAEGTAKSAPTTTQVMARNNNGETDTGNNNTDFTNTATNLAPPRNSASPENPGCTGSAPTVQVSALSFNNATDNSVDVSWTNGDGDGRMVKINTSSTFNNPVDGTSYTGTPVYPGSGEQVVFSGNGNTVSVSGLSPGQTYHFRGYEYNNTGLFYNITASAGNPNSITLDYPAPAAISLNPASAIEGGTSFTLSVSGSGFYPASVINWNGNPKTTTYVNSTTLTTTVDASDIATAGSASVSVTNPAPGGGTSAPLTFTITSATAPVITVSGNLNTFIEVSGTPSASQSYVVSGNNLSGDITITPPAGFEIRTGANAFSASAVVLTASGGSVATTGIDVRLNAASEGVYTGDISHSSAGANTENITVTGNSLAIEPSINSTISFGTVTGNSIEVIASGGNGSSRIIVVRDNSAGTYSPIDGAGVTGVDANFLNATILSDSSRIVYDGTGNSVVVTGLAGSTTYHFSVFEYNGSGATSNYGPIPATANVSTIATEPTTAATLTVTRVKPDSAFVSFTGGNGSGRMVVISTSPVSFIPDDGQTYPGADSTLTSAADLGAGNFLLYNGSAPKASLSIAGLTANTTYYVRSYDYNGSGGSINYRTSTFGTDTLETPIFLSYNGGTYQQDFNGLPVSGTFVTTGFGRGPYFVSTPPVNATSLTGWQYASLGGTNANVVFIADTGSSTSGGNRSYGLTNSTNRSLGSLAAGASVPTFGAVLVNNTGEPLETITINYTGKQWRNSGSGTPNILRFEYKLGGSGILDTAFTLLPSLDFQNPVSGGTGTPLNGNLPANQTALAATFTLNGNWNPGQTLVIRWVDTDDSGSDHGLAVDDFSFLAEGPTTPSLQDSLITFVNVLTTSMDVNWTSGDAANRIVVVNTNNSFTPPVDGTTYTANAVYGGSGEQVVFNGNANVANVSGLTAGTTYHFRVFGYNGSGNSTKYNTSTATDNPASQATAQPSAATRLVIVSVNGGNDPVDNTPFSVVVQAQDSAGNPQNVNLATTVSLSVLNGFGILGGTTTGTMTAGTNTLTISGVTYSPEDFAVELQADAIAGETLLPGVSLPFNVLGTATQLLFSQNIPAAGIVNTPLPPIVVEAYRNDFTIDQFFTGAVTLSKLSGPGNLTGTLTVNCVAGVATFTGIGFDQPGTYELEANATGLSPGFGPYPVIITLNPILTELVVPKYISGKPSPTASTHNARMPIAVCLQIDNLVPNTPYDVRAGIGLTSDPDTIYGSGNSWTGTSFGFGSILNAFSTDANGSSGPFWIYLQPTASSANARFAPDSLHKLRIGFVQSGGLMPLAPNFVGSKLIRALDIANTATATTTDDGAFLKGSSAADCLSGKYILVYDNEAGTGDPISSYQARQMTPTNSFQSELPTAISDILTQNPATAIGDYVALIPTGENNPNGIRRIEARNADNTLFNAVTDADGIWSGTINTATITRRSVATLTATDAPLTTLSITAAATDESCTGALDGTATATVITGNNPVSYSWNTTPEQTTAVATGLAAGSYTVTVTDASGCSQQATVTVNPPSSASITPDGPTTFCSGGSVVLSAGIGSAYLWSTGQTTQSITATQGGSYVVTVTTGTCNAVSLPVVVSIQNYAFSGTVFSENMGAPGGTTLVNSYTGWQNGAPVTFSSDTTATDVRTTTGSSGYLGSSGGGNVFFGTSGAGANNKQFIISGINTTGYGSLTLSYGLLRSTTTGVMEVSVSTDGITYTPLTVTQPTVANSWQLITVNSGIPSASNLRIKFNKNSTTQFRLDDVKITGTTSTVSVAPSGTVVQCGSIPVTLQANVPSGVLWSTGATTKAIQVTQAGDYSFIATDGTGCTASSDTTEVLFTTPPVWFRDLDADGFGNLNDTLSACTQPSGYVFDNSDCNDTLASVNPNGVEICNGIDDDCDGDTDDDDTNVTGRPLWYADVDGDGFGDASDTLRSCTQPLNTVSNGNDCDDSSPSVYPGAVEILCNTIDDDCDGATDEGFTFTGFSPSSGAAGATVVISGTGLSQVTAVSFNGTAASFTAFGDTLITTNTPIGATTGPIQLSIPGCSPLTSAGNFTIVSTGISLQLTAFIESYYLGAGLMKPVLSDAGVTTNTNETDSIRIELRDAMDFTTVLHSTTAVLSTGGQLSVTLPGSLSGSNAYIALFHRSAVQTWSANPVNLTGSAVSYDFSTSASQAFGANQASLGGGLFGLFSGDVNQDEVVDILDQIDVDNDAGNFGGGYVATDIDGDAVVDILDQIILDNNVANFVGAIYPF